MNLPNNAIIAGLCLIALVVVINIGLFYALRSKNTHEQIELIRKASQSARDPWKTENDSIDELAEKISQLQESHNNDMAASSEKKSGGN